MSICKSSSFECESNYDHSVLSNSLSFYELSNIPTAEIDQTISWLQGVKRDCDYKIGRLVDLKKRRQTSKKWRDDINSLSKQFCDPDSVHLDLETRINIIKQRLGVDTDKARNIALAVSKWAKNHVRKQRDELVYFQHLSGMKPPEIAAKHKISRQQVYNIIKKTAPKGCIK